MKSDRSLVRASDISAWVYCNRAWWLARIQGAAHEHPHQLARGVNAHAKHGRAVLTGEKARRIGFILMAGGALFVLLTAILWFVS